MSNRIEELEELCWESRQYGPPWFNANKFAELIVRECTNHVNQYINDCGEVASLPDYVLESHFGVK